MELTLFDQKITLSKIFHHGQNQLAISFDYHLKLVELIKTLPDRKYSKTYNCWLLPYTKEHYQKLLDLINETNNVGLANKTLSTGIIDTALSKDVHTGISSSHDMTEESSVLPPKSEPEAADIRETKPEIRQHSTKTSIVLNGGNFFIQTPYNPNDANFLRSLDKTYWNTKYQNWVVKATSQNLDKLQQRFSYWNQESYLQCYTLIMEVEDPYVVELFSSPEFPKHFLLRVKGSQADFEFLKALPQRDYQADFKRWLIPKEQTLLDRIVEHYETDGARIINKVVLHKGDFVIESKSPEERKQFLLGKFGAPLRTTLTVYVNTMIRMRYSWNTIKSYTGSFASFVQHFGEDHLNLLETSHVNDYMATIACKNASEALLHTHINSIKFYYAKVIFRSDFKLEEVQRPKQSHTLPKLLTIQEVDRMLRSLDNLKHITMLYALYSSGIRLQELLNITINDIFWERNQILVRGGKGKKDRMVMLSQVLKEVFVYYFDSYQPKYHLFEGQDGEHQYSPRSVQQVVKQAAKKAGITRTVTPHVLRHCFATHLLDNGTDVRYIQELLGHKDIKTTLIYTHVTNAKLETIKSPIDQLNLGNKFQKNANV
ncbi:MAG TPA: tyrosine-type recombinase/integrase [Saprospiraceae bacterium]|nr:tyrosine-type recombinase/integrase [Saprospiraceae bacterium]